MAADDSTVQRDFWGEEKQPRKRCGCCKGFFPLDDFSIVRQRGKAPRRHACCKRCKRARAAAWSKKHPVRHGRNCRKEKLKQNYGLTLAAYQALFDAQGGLCAICGRLEKARKSLDNKNPALLCVDHDHATGQVRQLLCRCCNVGLGKFDDNPEFMRRAAAYVEKHRLSGSGVKST